MANTYKALQTVTVGAGGVASISFTGIPQTYTDLVISASVRDNSAFTAQTFAMRINGVSGTSYTWLRLQGNGATASSDAFVSQDAMVAGATNAATSTSNTFNNSSVYVPNYAGNINNKTVSFDSVSENNATTAFAQLNTGVFNNSSPVTSITLYSTSGNLVQYSTATLYGVFNADVSGPPTAPTIGTATAGTESASITFTGVSNAASYTMTSSPGGITATGTTSPITVTGLTGGTPYTFTCTASNPLGSSGASAASNSVTPSSPFTLTYLALAGGGAGGGQNNGGGGGAGGYLESTTSIGKATNYTVTVGAGGAASSTQAAQNNGNNSVFGSITAIGGGGGGGQGASGNNGGCGGGGAYAGIAGGTGSQGGNGGVGANDPSAYGGGGGGGAAPANGGNGTSSNGGAGGSGRASSITGSSVTRGGGGGGGSNVGGAGGGSGGGGNGAYPQATNGGTNLGGGGGGCQSSLTTSGAGGSGIVILRWPTATATISIGAGLTGSTTTVGSDTVATITAGTGNVSWS
jgi:hypothetical protein